MALPSATITRNRKKQRLLSNRCDTGSTRKVHIICKRLAFYLFWIEISQSANKGHE